MSRKLVIFIGVFVLLVALTVFIISRFVKVTGPVVWIDRSNRGSWQTSANSATWWEQLSILNPNMIDKNRWVVVYLLPNLQKSQNAVWRKDHEPFIYTDWRVWGSGVQVLTVSINWDEWEPIDSVERQQKLAEFVAFKLAKYWGAQNKDTVEMVDKIVDGVIEPPIKIISAKKGWK